MLAAFSPWASLQNTGLSSGGRCGFEEGGSFCYKDQSSVKIPFTRKGFQRRQSGMELNSSSTESALSNGEEEEGSISGVEDLVCDALAWASLHGFVVGDPSSQISGRTLGVGLVHAPFSLLPTHFPMEKFKQAVELASLFNELVDRVSLDGEFLQEALSRTRKVDPFTARLLDIHSTVLQRGARQDIRLGLHRSDYMLDMATGDLLQIELNTISSSFVGLGTLVSQLHRFLLGSANNHIGLHAQNVPENRALDGFVNGLARTFQEYGDPSSVVLMVVQPEERNMYDQYWLSLRLHEVYGIKVIRRTLTEVELHAKLVADGTLVIGEQTIAVVYYRSGYGPNDYPSDAEWQARMLIECSAAIKCPSISYQLVGTKKIQQELAKPGMLERFMQNDEAVCKLRRCFAGLWDLQYDAHRTIIDKAIAKPDAFVLKPQREGGGNNIYGNDIKEKLIDLMKGDGDGLAAYILMQRIFPAVHSSFFVRNSKCNSQQAISELGIFGCYLRTKTDLIMNENAGYLLRTKASSSNEGGVATGFAVLDSVYLT